MRGLRSGVSAVAKGNIHNNLRVPRPDLVLLLGVTGFDRDEAKVGKLSLLESH